ncbi:Hpt domain-containing protein [Vibrio penaeicida]|uniref:Hpt domain-containing protein n=1 Tax=Vibrio penaeicida TaxID=104609 RepID=UPI0027329577|nr:Hpt domain-containing protein [Vibrio penaeicida]MDP2570608.1 Hpt domain-containing protein [Vibrio penaeicida]
MCDIFGDMDIAKQIVKEFIDSQNKDLLELSAAMENDNHNEIKQVTHRMKGAARMLECHALSNVLADFEHAATHEDSQKYDMLQTEVIAITNALNQFEYT